MSEQITTFKQLWAALRVDPRYCDALLIGDGSGSRADCPGGWAVNVIEMNRETQRPTRGTLLVGAQNQGSINFLEAVTYWYGLRHLQYTWGWDKLVTPNNPRYVVIVTDSEWTAKTMSGENRAKVHQDLKLMFDLYRSWGYLLYWHHAPREAVILNNLADLMSAAAREYLLMIERVDPLKIMKEE